MARSRVSRPSEENSIETATSRAPLESAAKPSQARDDDHAVPRGVQAERAAKTRADSASPAVEDTTSVPAGVRNRFVQIREKFYFPNGDPAFRDLGRKLTTRSENTEIVRSLVEIAQARGWDEITVGGTKDFRRAVWHEAALQKMGVRGYTPTEMDEARLVRAIPRRTESGRENATPEAPTPPPAERGAESRRPRRPADAPGPASPGAQRRMFYGELLAHGPENFRFDPHEDMSYFVQIKTDDGRKVALWGKDLERAIRQSKSAPSVGDRICISHIGNKEVTVPKKERDEQGNVIREYDIRAHRNEWTVESEAFFKDRAKLAEVVRDPRIDARRAVEMNPELAGTYASLKAAELIGQGLADKVDQQRFIETVRRTLAREIRNGKPLYAPVLRDRPRAAERTATRQPPAPESAPAR